MRILYKTREKNDWLLFALHPGATISGSCYICWNILGSGICKVVTDWKEALKMLASTEKMRVCFKPDWFSLNRFMSFLSGILLLLLNRKDSKYVKQTMKPV